MEGWPCGQLGAALQQSTVNLIFTNVVKLIDILTRSLSHFLV
jgi:hypothetical protein